MKYFLHDSNSFNDEKITELFVFYGYEGLGLFYTILEKLAQQEKPIKTFVLKRQLKVGKKLEKCWKFMESIDLISSNNDETFNKQLLNFSGKYAIKKEKNAKRIYEWREKQIVAENVTRSESVRNADKVNKSKVNKSKVIDKDAEVSALEQKIEKFKQSLYPFTKNKGGAYDAETVKEFFDYWSELNKSQTKMKWELQQTFEISKRLVTWQKNKIKFNDNGDSKIQSANSSYRKNTAGANAEDKKRSVDRLADMAETILQNLAPCEL